MFVPSDFIYDVFGGSQFFFLLVNYLFALSLWDLFLVSRGDQHDRFSDSRDTPYFSITDLFPFEFICLLIDSVDRGDIGLLVGYEGVVTDE